MNVTKEYLRSEGFMVGDKSYDKGLWGLVIRLNNYDPINGPEYDQEELIVLASAALQKVLR